MSYENSHYTNLGQLKKALLRSHDEVSELAALVVGTLEDMILQANISVATSAWAANADAATLAEGYAYKADVEVEGLIENANVNVTLDVPSLSVAKTARVCKTALVSTGSIRFYAKTVPTAALTGKLDAIQLDDSGENNEQEE